MNNAKETVRSIVRQFNVAEGSVNAHIQIAAEQARTGAFDFTALSPEYLDANPEVVNGLTRAFIAKHGGHEDIIPTHLTQDQIEDILRMQLERIRQETIKILDNLQ